MASVAEHADGVGSGQGKAGVLAPEDLAEVIQAYSAVAERLRAAGYAESYAPSVHPARLRRYFEDGCGFEWEFVQYLTEDPAERFAYG